MIIIAQAGRVVFHREKPRRGIIGWFITRIAKAYRSAMRCSSCGRRIASNPDCAQCREDRAEMQAW